VKDFDSTPGAGSYLESFSLSCEPFADTIDNRFFYGATTLMQRLDLLSHLTQFGDDIVLVSGPPGSGKTTLLSRFAGQANSQWHLCLMNGDEFDRFPQRLADTLKSETPAGEQELFSEWAARTDNSQLLVIVIDNSEQLDEDAFERLCALLGQGNAKTRVRLILFGRPAAQQAYRQAFEQKQQALSTQLLEMPRLSEEETAAYLMYRLAVAGYNGENPFTATEIRAICKASDGRPAAINQHARQSLEEHQARVGSTHIRIPRGHRPTGSMTWGLGAAGILLVAIWLGWQQFYPPATDGMPAVQAPIEERPLAIPELAAPASPTASADTPTKPETLSAETLTDIPVAEPAPPATADAGPEAAGADAAKPEPAAEIPSTAGTDATPASDKIAASDPVIPAATGPATVPAAAADTQQNTTSLPAVNTPTPQAAGEMQQTTGPPPAHTSANAAAAAEADRSVPETAVASATAPARLPHREDWLLQQPETAFTLQLLGSRNAESIARYLERHRLDYSQAALYRGRYKGAEWYVLLYGIYPNRQTAIDARATLPAAVRKDKPWPRTLKTVHKAIREAR